MKKFMKKTFNSTTNNNSFKKLLNFTVNGVEISIQRDKLHRVCNLTPHVICGKDFYNIYKGRNIDPMVIIGAIKTEMEYYGRI